ncbi:hypothetical protein [Komagataeibacter intermedius]|uniref:ANTAR domain-containing protein n=1 Tax=Komagataeibacter intermedius NRIC 0521 TaxID=1307934 RepID=A0ABQ0PGT2_9PROT|nr:hypothetical protein [Komagataeibacter intermedius]GAN86392.1 hypothetical protein Gain_0027_067 [Komagataeibacter intermedius TF2]GBQ68084.1 hypothetical protein AA0521_1150 [Komagataeibacter intermedius NRIC 0521]
MCSSENELIHDVRQVHLEELIMKNEEQFVMVPVRLSAEQSSLVGPMVAHDWGIIIQHAGTPIPPCADVETVGYVHGDYPKQGHRAVMCPPSMRDPISGRIEHFDTALVRRTDMEAQVAKVAAEKDAEIARLSDALNRMIGIAISRATVQTVEAVVSERTSMLRDAIVHAACDLADGVDVSTVCRNLRAALNKGSGA